LSSALTYAWADPGAGSFGLARLDLEAETPGTGGLAIVFSGAEVLAVAQPDDLAETESPDGWTLSFSLETGAPVELTFTPIGPSAEFLSGTAAADAGGMESREQPCAVSGTVGTTTVEGHGQRGQGWGEVDWSELESARTISAWLEDGRSFLASAIRRPGGGGHEADAVTAYFVDPEAEAPPAPLDEARISTAYDADGRQRRAGLELYETEETQVPRRGAGTLLCGTSLDLGELRLDTAFFAWGISGVDGVGRYDHLHRA
jgi:hypothetical protein